MARILILSNSDLGLYKFRREFIEALQKENKVYLSLPKGELVTAFCQMGCQFYATKMDRRGLNPFKDFLLLLRYLRIIWTVKPDFIISYTIKPNLYGGILARTCHIPYAMNITGLGSVFQRKGILQRMVVGLYGIACKGARVVFFENSENRQCFLERGILSHNKAIQLNGAGVNLEEYIYTKLPSEDGGIRFLFVGRIMRDKGIEELVEAAVKLKDLQTLLESTDLERNQKEIKKLLDTSDMGSDGNNPCVTEQRLKNHWRIQIDIVGDMEEDYVDFIKKYHRKGIIQYHGFRKDVKPFLQKAHCVVLPSYHEGMSNVLLEGAAMGRALITSDIPGCREVVVDGVNGYLTRVCDGKHLYENMLKYVLLSYEEKALMGYKSRKHVEANFNRKEIVSLTVDWLEILSLKSCTEKGD